MSLGRGRRARLTSDDTVLETKNLGLVVAGEGWVSVGHAWEHWKSGWDVWLLHLVRRFDSLNYKLITAELMSFETSFSQLQDFKQIQQNQHNYLN